MIRGARQKRSSVRRCHLWSISGLGEVGTAANTEIHGSRAIHHNPPAEPGTPRPQPHAAEVTVALQTTANARLREGIRFAQEGLWEEAADTWNKLIGQAPENAAAHYNLGMARRVLGDPVGEREHLEQAVALRPSERLYLRALARAKHVGAPR